MPAILAFDFDGVIVSYAYPCIGTVNKGAIETINSLFDRGFCIIINSCRAREQKEEMIRWLHDNGVKYCHVNENCRCRIADYKTDCRKISADMYFDDKSVMSLDYKNQVTWKYIDEYVSMKYGSRHKRRCGYKSHDSHAPLTYGSRHERRCGYTAID